MWWVVLAIFVYLLTGLIQFYFSLYRKHRKATLVEKAISAFFYPGNQITMRVAIGVSTLFGWNK